jgi:hypothetical protein
MNQMLKELDDRFKEFQDLREQLKKVEFPLVPSFDEDFDSTTRQLKSRGLKLREDIHDRLENFLIYPPHLSTHFSKLEQFYDQADYVKSVFVMTKFPVAGHSLNDELMRVINAVRSAVRGCGYYPRVAFDVEYYERTWSNVELYMLGCSKGIAILEDRFTPEHNPNVAMEWGWMTAMHKEVFLLIDSKFEHYKADWMGLSEHRFSWEEPENDISAHIKNWLGS